MKRIINIVFITLLFFASCATRSSSSGPEKKLPKLKVQGTQLMNDKNETVVLHGMSFGWHNWWPRFYNEGTTRELVRNWNSTVVRAAMGIEPKGNAYLQAPEKSERLIRTVIDAAIKENIYVIVDWHAHDIHTEKAKDFFARIAADYKDYPNIIYEIFNEPDHETWEEVKAYSEEVIKAIREHDKDNIILVGSPHWDQDIHLAAADPIKGYNNLMYTLHFYAATHKQYLRDRGDQALQAGLPLFVSECAGMEATGNGPLDIEEWNNWVVWMDKNKLSWVAWSIADKNETCSVLLPTANSEGGWKKEDIKEWGHIVRKALQKYAK